MSDKNGSTIPDGLPGPREIKHRTEQAARVLTARKVTARADPALTHLQVQAVIRALVRTGLMSQEQLDYYFALVRMETLEGMVEQSGPPKLHVPGRQS